MKTERGKMSFSIRLILSALISVVILLCLAGIAGCSLSNKSPVINILRAEKELIRTGERCRLTSAVSDPDGDTITYIWVTNAGVIKGTGADVVWTAPDKPGTYNVVLKVTDDKEEAESRLEIEVKENQSPVIKSVKADPSMVRGQEKSSIECIAYDADGDELDYSWSAQAGKVEGSGVEVVWTSPDEVGTYPVTVKVSDGYGGSVIRQIDVLVKDNQPPVIKSLSAKPLFIRQGDLTTLECKAVDPDGDELSYKWSSDFGKFIGEGSTVEWEGPEQCAMHTIKVTVTDGFGGMVNRDIQIKVLKKGG